jgi:hypothetical protein
VDTQPTELEKLPDVITAWGREYRKGPVMWTEVEDADGFEITVTWTTGNPNEGDETEEA